MLWIVFSITKGIFLLSCRSSGPEINFWKPSKIESKCILSCPLSLSLLPWNKLFQYYWLPLYLHLVSIFVPLSSVWLHRLGLLCQLCVRRVRRLSQSSVKAGTTNLQMWGPPGAGIYFAGLQSRPSQPAWGPSSSGSPASFVSEYSSPRWASCECWVSCWGHGVKC